VKTTTFGQALSNFIALTKAKSSLPHAENPVWNWSTYIHV